MYSFYFFSKQLISVFHIGIKLIALIGNALLNDLKLAIYNFKVLKVLLVRYHHILKGIDYTDWYVVPFIRSKHSQLVFKSSQLCLILETLRYSGLQMLSNATKQLFLCNPSIRVFLFTWESSC